MRVGHLGLTDDEGRPRVMPVTFVVAEGAAWTAVDHKPKRVPGERLARVRWLEQRPASSLTVDRYDDDWSRLAWVQLLGRTEVLGVTGHPAIVSALAARYPQYREHPRPARCCGSRPKGCCAGARTAYRHRETMAKVWVLDTETKGTGAQMVPLEKVLRKPEPKPARPPVPERRPRPEPEPEPARAAEVPGGGGPEPPRPVGRCLHAGHGRRARGRSQRGGREHLQVVRGGGRVAAPHPAREEDPMGVPRAPAERLGFRPVALDLSDPASINTSSLGSGSSPEEERDEAFAVLRREAPAMAMPPLEPELAVIAQENPTGYRAIVRHADIKAISRDAKTYSSAAGVLADDAPLEIREATLSFISMDAPRHTKLRGLVSSAFTPRQIARIEEGIRRHAKAIVAEAAPTGGGDFVKLIAKRLPLQTISDMIGVPEADRERIVNAADAIVSVGDESFTAGREPMQVLGEAIWTLSQFATEMAEHREKNPGDDLMTALVQAEIDGDRLTHAEISAWFVLLSVAGNDTTRHTTSHAMRALTLHPDQRALLTEDLDARLPAAVEEFVRWATPVLHFRRTTTRPVELHGEQLEEGEKVVLFYLRAIATRRRSTTRSAST